MYNTRTFEACVLLLTNAYARTITQTTSETGISTSI